MDEVLPLARPNFSLVADSSKLGPRRRTHATMSHHDTHGSLKRFSSDCHPRLCALLQLWALADSLTLATEHVRRCSILPAVDIEPLAPSHRRQLISQRLNVYCGKVTASPHVFGGEGQVISDLPELKEGTETRVTVRRKMLGRAVCVVMRHR
ncbi:hypothetical protein E4U30_006993 [Claviceps sp. LM220 group G6]|nr:hypothetical protein E4U30_006993 [Claviceps sp. LM220 group G6]